MAKTAKCVGFGNGVFFWFGVCWYAINNHFKFFNIMAKTNGIIKIEGTIDDLTFYKKNGATYVRKKSGVNKDRIANDPNFVRTRENNSEFSHSVAQGKLLRMAMGSLTFKAKDAKLSNRLMQTMSKIKNLDTASARGQRQVSLGITTPEGKNLLKGFDFNTRAPLKGVLFSPFALDTATGSISFTSLLPAEQLQVPQGATHVSFAAAVLHLDFETGDSEIAYSPSSNFAINLTPQSFSLTPASVPTGAGRTFFLLHISFFQEVNGLQYSLKNEEYNVLNIVEVL